MARAVDKNPRAVALKSKRSKRGAPNVYRPGELNDHETLPGEVRHLRREMNEGFSVLGNRIMPALIRIEETLTDLRTRVHDLEHADRDTKQRLAALELERKGA